MIYLIIGENAYLRAQELAKLKKAFAGEPEQYDGTSITENMLADMIAGATLFSNTRLVIIDQLSSNKPVWEKLSEWLIRASADTTLVLLEPSPDKRLKAYKTISKAAKIIQALPLTDRDWRDGEAWLDTLARQAKVNVSPLQTADMVRRAMVPASKPGSYIIDQYMLLTALRTLSALDHITDDDIATVLPDKPAESAFGLLERAVQKDVPGVLAMVHDLKTADDAHKVFGLLASQWVQTLALAVSLKSPAETAGDIGMHPFVAGKTAALAANVNATERKKLTALLAALDAKLKLSEVEPWNAVERFLLGVATR